MIIIGLTGKKQSGKTTAANILQSNINAATRQVAFADALKFEVARACGVSVELIEINKKVFRPILQWWGTDFKRNLVGESYWIDRLNGALLPLHDIGTRAVIIPDVRFLNEAKYIRDMRGIIIRIERTSQEKDMHLSETEQDNISPDYTIYNNGSLNDLKNELRNIIKDINSKQTPKHHI